MSGKVEATAAAQPKMTREEVASELALMNDQMFKMYKWGMRMGFADYGEFPDGPKQIYFKMRQRRDQLMEMLVTDEDRASEVALLLLQKFRNYDYHKALEAAVHFGLLALEKEESVSLELIEGPPNSPPQQLLIEYMKLTLKNEIVSTVFPDLPGNVKNVFSFETMLFEQIDWVEALNDLDGSKDYISESPLQFRGEEVVFADGEERYPNTMPQMNLKFS